MSILKITILKKTSLILEREEKKVYNSTLLLTKFKFFLLIHF